MSDRILYHYPDTTRRGRDEAEVAATKNAATLELPVFVITPGSRSSVRSVRRGAILGWDDELALFRIALDAPVASPRRRRAAVSGATGRSDLPYREADETSASSPRDPFTIDPNKIDRGLRSHARTQNALAGWLMERGYVPFSPAGAANFDLAWRAGGHFFVAEVKSLTNTNEPMQLRLGLGQVLDYAAMLRAEGEPDVVPVLVPEREPADPRWCRTCERAGVVLTWPDTFPRLT